MDHGLELIIARLEIVEIGVCNILQNPGNIGKRIFLLSHILEILENTFFLTSHMMEILDRTIHISVLSWKYWIVWLGEEERS